MPRTTFLIFLAGLLATLSSCGGEDTAFQVNPDSGTSDSDSDSDVDSDSDSDSDTDVDPDDNDGDWLSNSFEDELGTDPDDADSDDDGASDLIEWLAETDPNDPEDNPAANGELWFLAPFDAAPDPLTDTLSVPSDIRHADLFFLMDTTGSMGGAITNLKNDLSTVIIPGVEEMIADPWFAVGGFDDYPVSPYGSSYVPDEIFYLLQRTTPSATDAQTAVNLLTTHSGGDMPEGQVPALWATATGEGLGTYLEAQDECEPTEKGYPCFRPGALPIVVLITDATFHNAFDEANTYATIDPVPPTWAEAVTELNEIHAKVLSAWIETTWASDVDVMCEQMAWDTGAVTAEDDPVTVPVETGGVGLGDDVITALETLTTSVPYTRVEGIGRDDAADDIDAIEAFLRRIEPNTEGGIEDPLNPGIFCSGMLGTVDDNDDDIPDAFINVLPGTPVCFDVVPRANDSVLAAEDPQVFGAFVDELADGFTVLETRSIYFVVPPSAPVTE